MSVEQVVLSFPYLKSLCRSVWRLLYCHCDSCMCTGA